MYNLIGVCVIGSDCFGKYVAVSVDGYNLNLFRDYTDKPKDIMKAYEKHKNITGCVKWIVVNK